MSHAVLQRLVAAGELGPEDLVQDMSGTRWERLDERPDLVPFGELRARIAHLYRDRRDDETLVWIARFESFSGHRETHDHAYVELVHAAILEFVDPLAARRKYERLLRVADEDTLWVAHNNLAVLCALRNEHGAALEHSAAAVAGERERLVPLLNRATIVAHASAALPRRDATGEGGPAAELASLERDVRARIAALTADGNHLAQLTSDALPPSHDCATLLDPADLPAPDRTVTAHDPNRLEAGRLLERATAALEAGRWAEARVSAAHAREQCPHNPAVRAEAERIASAADERARAAEARARRERYAAALDRVREWETTGEFERALVELEALPPAPGAAGDVYEELRQVELRIRAAIATASLSRGQQLEDGDPEGALDAYRSAEDAPGSAHEARVRADAVEARVAQEKAQRALREGDLEGAARQVERLRELPGRGAIAASLEDGLQRKRGAERLEVARLALADGRFSDAREAARRALELDEGLRSTADELLVAVDEADVTERGANVLADLARGARDSALRRLVGLTSEQLATETARALIGLWTILANDAVDAGVRSRVAKSLVDPSAEARTLLDRALERCPDGLACEVDGVVAELSARVQWALTACVERRFEDAATALAPLARPASVARRALMTLAEIELAESTDDRERRAARLALLGEGYGALAEQRVGLAVRKLTHASRSGPELRSSAVVAEELVHDVDVRLACAERALGRGAEDTARDVLGAITEEWRDHVLPAALRDRAHELARSLEHSPRDSKWRAPLRILRNLGAANPRREG